MNRDMERLDGARKLIEVMGLDTDELIILAMLSARDAGRNETWEKLARTFPLCGNAVGNYREAA